MYPINGGCHCGNIVVQIELSEAPGAYRPRACDCDFCRKHGAAYVSDPKGSLSVVIRDARECSPYRQGNEIARFLLCRNCGVLVGARHQLGQRLYATINVRALEGAERFGAEEVVSPRKLSGDEKVLRWEKIWFSNVSVRGEDPSGSG